MPPKNLIVGFQGTVFTHGRESARDRPLLVGHIGFLRAGWAERGMTARDSFCTPVLCWIGLLAGGVVVARRRYGLGSELGSFSGGGVHQREAQLAGLLLQRLELSRTHFRFVGFLRLPDVR